MAPPPPPLPTPVESLEDLPDDILRMILSRIPCRVDRVPIALVCPAWRDMIRRHRAQAPPPLPWLLTPFPDGSIHVVCVLSGCRVHQNLTINPPGARFFGSHDGAWIFLHYRDHEPRGNHAHNVRTKDVERLPVGLLGQDGMLFDNMVVRAAALSSAPDDATCIAAAIVVVPLPGPAPNAVPRRRRCVAFWRKGWELARELVPPEQDVALEVDDVVYHNGAFHMLTQGDHIRVCKPTIEPQDEGLPVNWEWETRRFQFQAGGGIYDQHVHARYLVVSREELLLVLRFTPQPNLATSKFKVYKETDADANAYYPVAQYPWAWSELDTLGDRMLFVGHGCCRSYEVDQYPGFKDGIYFIDDREFYNVQVMFGNARRYPCSDNGKWSEGDVQRCFPAPHISNHSAPAWLLP
ncbi:hypothetical protein BAE44_0014324 [Dichanthelium oligosanthes]|uniref:F-box domain-containing protein n=1 Tax=Dichanthelium oligosanthes TaxID=888268 RepID=A0A1E5VHQ0_9POAL|nr:hypothetical protein BAE44_0014324 [Dichanthelium oligosanthes]